ncbi:mechanosensitive channel MscK [Pseudomonas matsuisoli]|uniref:Potassium transporter KefA n=1 Tax=Pseudomonas matsuisoli TaxID=1515666 RepID=A0A917Q354_9PSED|nr:mechanosensitive channel MscK [Pseudomonas matsuisoli]GGK09708.1 potassium transporter KefA [Pseudomonas matsuisoli]
MRLLYAFSAILLLNLLPIGGVNAAASDAPTTEQVQSSLDKIAERKLPEAEQAAVQQTLEGTLGFLKSQADAQQGLEALKTQIDQAPQETEQAHKELLALKDQPPTDIQQRYANASVQELEKQLAERNAKLEAWQKALTEANSLIITGQTRPERAQAEIGSSQARAQQISQQLKGGKDGTSKSLTSDQIDQLNAELAAIDAQNALRRAQLAGNSALQDLGNARRELLNEQIARAEKQVLDLQALINARRRALSAETFAELSKEADQTASDGLLSGQRAINLRFSDYLLRATDRLNEVTQENLQAQQQLDNIKQIDQTLDEQISVLSGSLLLSKVLYQQKQALPNVKFDTNLAEQIADIRLYQFELNQERDQLSDPVAFVDQLITQSSEEPTSELRASLLDLVKQRIDLMERMNRELNTLLSESITLQLNQTQLSQTVQQLSATLEEQMFWIPSNSPLDSSWFAALPVRLWQQLQSLPWTATLAELGRGLSERPLVFLPLLLVIGVLTLRRKAISNRLTVTHRDIGNVKRDSQWHTPRALLFNTLLAMPMTLFLGLCGYALLLDGRGQNANVGMALIQMAKAWLVFYTAYRILKHEGVAELHFRWDAKQVAFLHREIRKLGLVVMALVAVVVLAERQPSLLANDVLGILVVVTCYGLMSWLLVKTLVRGPSSENAPPFRIMLALLFSMLPVALIIAVGFGYYYTALKLTDRLIGTLYLFMLWTILEAAVVRGLAVAARRLAYKRALAKREAQLNEGIDDKEPIEEPVLDMEQINQQSLRLLRLGLFGLFIAGLYWVWSDLLGVLTYLDNVTLYEYTSGTGTTAVQVPITLLNVVGALTLLGITVMLAGNLPGLLQVLVLSRMRLAQGSAYATTTLLSYTITGVGLVSTLSTLGVSWDKLQWLVAALSVGLGFGLQEIFANFISGLIILFERPVRIGDLVTIGNLTGTVSKIRIRATTITDPDNKEIIVPNKTFITSQLINWTLTDTMTRVVVKVGVAHGSDLDKVHQLLLDAAHQNPRVLKDPEPAVFFTLFGESTLDHELRVHVRELVDRLTVADELGRWISREFPKHDVKIAFRQVDVYIKNYQGDERQIQKGVVEAAAAAASDQRNPPLPPAT